MNKKENLKKRIVALQRKAKDFIKGFPATSDNKSQLATLGENSKNRILLVFDATGSRKKAWKTAQKNQSHLMQSLERQGNFEIAIAAHSGNKAEFLGTFDRAADSIKAMKRLSCKEGHTRYVEALSMAYWGLGHYKPLDAIVLIGDDVEEHIGIGGDIDAKGRAILDAAKKFYAPVFVLHEYTSERSKDGRKIFRHIAHETGGAIADLDNFTGVIEAIGSIITGNHKQLTGIAKEALETLVHDNPKLLLLSNNRKKS